jgi:AraC-like DNA-binding protein
MKQIILIVEDELLIAFDLKEIIEEDGFDAIINVVTVAQAIEVIESEKPVLVLIDINLKDKDDGVALGHYLLKKDTIPYLFITSHSDKATLQRVNETRPHGFIVKPFKPIDIKTTISIVLNNYQHKSIDPMRSDEPMKDDAPFRIREVVNFINKNVCDKIEIEDLAVLTKWKKHHFIRMFTKHLSITPYQYILKTKIEKAKLLISETNQPITEISQDLGFESYSNFCIAFKKLNDGKNPETFKKAALAYKNIK